VTFVSYALQQVKKTLGYEERRSFIDQEILRNLYDHDPFTYWHSLRVGYWLKQFSYYLGYSIAEQHALFETGIVHDLGKIDIPYEVLNSKNKLKAKEWQLIKSHSIKGKERLSKHNIFSNEQLSAVLEHHENMDGSGYPRSLLKGEISAYGRLLRIVDSFDAMTCHRPYGHPKHPEAALIELEKEKGRLYDDLLVCAFISFHKGDKKVVYDI